MVSPTRFSSPLGVSSSPSQLVLFTLLLFGAAAMAASGAGKQKINAVSSNVLKGCIDDSDCKKLGEGSKYMCFLVRRTIL